MVEHLGNQEAWWTSSQLVCVTTCLTLVPLSYTNNEPRISKEIMEGILDKLIRDNKVSSIR